MTIGLQNSSLSKLLTVISDMSFLLSTAVSFVETFEALAESVMGKGQEMMFPAKEVPLHVVHAMQSSTNLKTRLITFHSRYILLFIIYFIAIIF